jgi:hypothetical protein
MSNIMAHIVHFRLYKTAELIELSPKARYCRYFSIALMQLVNVGYEALYSCKSYVKPSDLHQYL